MPTQRQIISVSYYDFDGVPEVTLDPVIKAISNGNRTEWSPIRPVIIRAITKSDRDRAAGVRFVYHENVYRTDDTKCYYQFILKITVSEKRRAKL